MCAGGSARCASPPEAVLRGRPVSLAVALVTVTGAGASVLVGAERLATGQRATASAQAVTAGAGAGAGPPATVPVRRVGALVRRRTVLRARPGLDGRWVDVLGRRTGFDGRQLLAVVAHRPGWVGVLHPSLANGRAGWIPADAVRVVERRWELEVDRSERVVRARYDGRFVARFPVSVGRSSSPTPVGRYAVTDRLRPRGASPYGCCILALSGRQDDLPQGWSGGDRLALHGSPSDAVGEAASAGCLRLRERDLRWLMRRIPVGTRVDVVA